MKLISESDIDTAVERMGSFGTDPLGDLFLRMREEQADLCRYLLEADADEFNEDERDLLVTISVVAWFIMNEIMGQAPPKSGEFLDYLLERNLDRFEDPDDQDQTADSFFDELITGGAGQPILMDFLIRLALNRPGDYPGVIRDDHVPSIVMHVKTVVDALALDEGEWEPEEAVGEYSDEALVEAQGVVSKMYDEFEKSGIFEALGEGERRDARTIITAFGEFMYNYFLLMPADWTARRAAEVCVEIMPRKMRESREFYAAIRPVLISFMKFASQKGKVPRAARIAERLAGLIEGH